MIKENAPNGATHYMQDVDGEVFYFKFPKYDVYQYVDDWIWVDNIEDYPNYYNDLNTL